MECGVDPSSAYANVLLIICQTTLMGSVGAYSSQKRLYFLSQSELVTMVYVAYRWVIISSVLDPL